ncbi:hypothetical protein GCM10009122_42320 [Fulvivirga kasyanovii]|uniref:hypothetical protein n=1 Tax=Fulvivirga kasyanovii TaxID=396812 RepID=UPI0031DE1440
MKKNIELKKESLRNPILKLLDKDDSASLHPNYLYGHFKHENPIYIDKVLRILVLDGVVHKLERDEAGNEIVHYVISAKGKDLLDTKKKNNQSFVVSLTALLLSAASVLISLLIK